MHYYYQKYPYLHYNYLDTDGVWTMFSIPPKMLMDEFVNKFGYKPKIFFDCGAATGVIVPWLSTVATAVLSLMKRKFPPCFAPGNLSFFLAFLADLPIVKLSPLLRPMLPALIFRLLALVNFLALLPVQKWLCEL